MPNLPNWLNPPIATSVALRVGTVYDLPAPVRLAIAYLVALLLAAGLSPDVVGVLLALLGLIPLAWPQTDR